jgi:hypothetical protein
VYYFIHRSAAGREFPTEWEGWLALSGIEGWWLIREDRRYLSGHLMAMA